MQRLYIEKVANGYKVEISGDYGVNDIEDEVYVYSTKDEMEVHLPVLINRAHSIHEQIQANKKKK